jgi:hypothetical protein
MGNGQWARISGGARLFINLNNRELFTIHHSRMRLHHAEELIKRKAS